ncbi:DDE-type integrase/transposase/recombinase [Streptomyces sp. NPDC051572]|uniref:DDE-type integrase/transposase/recombinase n=1 Tax=Streptomyces sp. NPDC051572 TaxID=3155802 RepID=UPI00344EA6C5
MATVIDIASRRVVGWSTADHLRTELVADALKSACRERRPTRPVIFHSDRGCQYTSQQFTSLATELGVRLSVGRTGQCWDNALAESFFATIKRELLGTAAWPSRAAARTAIFDFNRGLVQPAPAAQQPRLPQSCRIRDRTRSLTTTPTVFVKAKQAHFRLHRWRRRPVQSVNAHGSFRAALMFRYGRALLLRNTTSVDSGRCTRRCPCIMAATNAGSQT